MHDRSGAAVYKPMGQGVVKVSKAQRRSANAMVDSEPWSACKDHKDGADMVGLFVQVRSTPLC